MGNSRHSKRNGDWNYYHNIAWLGNNYYPLHPTDGDFIEIPENRYLIKEVKGNTYMNTLLKTLVNSGTSHQHQATTLTLHKGCFNPSKRWLRLLEYWDTLTLGLLVKFLGIREGSATYKINHGTGIIFFRHTREVQDVRWVLHNYLVDVIF